MRNYAIKVVDEPYKKREKLRSILEERDEIIYHTTSAFNIGNPTYDYFKYMHNDKLWAGSNFIDSRYTLISLNEFINKFEQKVRRPKQKTIKTRNKQ